MKYFKNDAEKNIEDKEISLDFALEEINRESTNEDNFIGFTSENGDTIQFIRGGEDDWLIDFPTPEKEYDSLRDSGLTTEKVKEIVKMFALNQNWHSLCKLTPFIYLTTKLCPFFKTNCKGNQCVMCRNGKCLIVNYLGPSDCEVSSGEGQIEDAKTSFPEWLKTATPESLAKEMLEFKNEQFPKDEEVQFIQLSNLFWSNKGVDRCCLPAEIELKVSQAKSKAENQFKKEREEKRKIMCDELVKEILGNKKKYGIEGKTGKAGHTVTMKQISSILLDLGKPDLLSYDLHPRINRELLRD